MYRRADLCRLESFAHANDANDEENGRSVSRTMTEFGGAALSWSSTIQMCVTLSSLEAEHVALADRKGCPLLGNYSLVAPS